MTPAGGATGDPPGGGGGGAETPAPDRPAAAREGPAAARWRRLVSERIEELRRLAPDRGELDGGFWERRAARLRAGAVAAPADDPFVRRLRRLAGPAATVVDAGAGAGRFALALAPGVAHVTAVDPSAAMLAVLEREARRLALENVTTVRARWERGAAEPADVAFSAFVLTLVPDAPAFVRALEAAAREHAVLYLGAYCGDAALDPLWRHFHGAPRAPGATYLDALALLRELGIEPRVEVLELPSRQRFATVAEAAEHYAEWLLVGDDRGARSELEDLLGHWLLGRRGALRSPLRSQPAAVISWRPRGAV